jgi:hypothetical protein
MESLQYITPEKPRTAQEGSPRHPACKQAFWIFGRDAPWAAYL